MRLVKAVVCELLDVIKYLSDDIWRVSPLQCSDTEVSFQHVDLIRYLLGNGLSQKVCLAKSKSCDLLSDLHDLFLVDHYSIGFLQNRYQIRMSISDI